MKCNIPPLAWIPKNIFLDFFWSEIVWKFQFRIPTGIDLNNSAPPNEPPPPVEISVPSQTAKETEKINANNDSNQMPQVPLDRNNTTSAVVQSSNAGCCQFCPHHHHHHFVKCRLLSILSTSSSSPFRQMQVVVNFVHIIIFSILSVTPTSPTSMRHQAFVHASMFRRAAYRQQ